jgi:flagellar secretion chaperone FliS
MNPGYARYAQLDFNTSNPMKIVMMLYDGAITFLKKASDCADRGDIKNKNVFANNARDIIAELNSTLNMEAGGEIAQSLRKLYFFMERHLMQANRLNNTQGFNDIVDLLSNLREAWQEVYQQKASLLPPPPLPRQSAMGIAV